jgi:hypothetical protein
VVAEVPAQWKYVLFLIQFSTLAKWTALITETVKGTAATHAPPPPPPPGTALRTPLSLHSNSAQLLSVSGTMMQYLTMLFQAFKPCNNNWDPMLKMPPGERVGGGGGQLLHYPFHCIQWHEKKMFQWDNAISIVEAEINSQIL